jgi:hypothetical protein
VALKKRNSNIKKFDEESIIMVKEKDVKNLTMIDHQSFKRSWFYSHQWLSINEKISSKP